MRQVPWYFMLLFGVSLLLLFLVLSALRLDAGGGTERTLPYPAPVTETPSPTATATPAPHPTPFYPTPNLFLSLVPITSVRVGQEFSLFYRFGNTGQTNGGSAQIVLFTPRGTELAGQPMGANVRCTVLSAEYDPAVVCRADSIPLNWQHYILLKYRVRVRIATTLLVQGHILSPYDESDYGNNLLNYAIQVTETTAAGGGAAEDSEETRRARAEWAAEMAGAGGGWTDERGGGWLWPWAGR